VGRLELGLGSGLGLGLALGLQLGRGIGFGRNHSWWSTFTPRRNHSLCLSEKRAWPGTHDHLNFGGLNADCSNMVADTDFRFEKHVP